MFLVFLNQKKTIQLIYKIQEGKFIFASYAVFLFNVHLPKRSSFEFILDSTTALGKKQCERSSSRIHNAPESPHWAAMLSSGHGFSIYSVLTPTSSFLCVSSLPGYFWRHRLKEIILRNRQSNSLKGSLSTNWRKPGSSACNQKWTSSLPLCFSLPGRVHVMRNLEKRKLFQNLHYTCDLSFSTVQHYSTYTECYAFFSEQIPYISKKE